MAPRFGPGMGGNEGKDEKMGTLVGKVGILEGWARVLDGRVGILDGTTGTLDGRIGTLERAPGGIICVKLMNFQHHAK